MSVAETSTCERKKQYKRRAEAAIARQDQEQRNKDAGTHDPYNPLIPYSCAVCGQWHIGHLNTGVDVPRDVDTAPEFGSKIELPVPVTPLDELAEDCTAAEYFAFDAESNSRLKDFAESVELYYGRHVAKTIPASKHTAATLLGTLVHCWIFEAALFWSRFVVEPNINRRTNAGKEEYAAFMAAAAASGQIVVEQEQIDLSRRIAEAVFRHPKAAELLRKERKAEHVITWIDPYTGLLCKSRRDGWIVIDNTIIDLKAVREASPGGFAKAAENFGYGNQNAFYCAGHAEVYDEVPTFLNIAVQTSPTHHPVGVYEMPHDWVAECHLENIQRMRAIAARRVSGDWREPWSNGILSIERPRWGKYKNEYDLNDEGTGE